MENDRNRVRTDPTEHARKRQKRLTEETAVVELSEIDSGEEEIQTDDGDDELMCCEGGVIFQIEHVITEVKLQVDLLNVTFSWSLSDRSAARLASRAIAKFAKNEEMVSAIVDVWAVPALVKHLHAPPIDLEREIIGKQLPFENNPHDHQPAKVHPGTAIEFRGTHDAFLEPSIAVPGNCGTVP